MKSVERQENRGWETGGSVREKCREAGEEKGENKGEARGKSVKRLEKRGWETREVARGKSVERPEKRGWEVGFPRWRELGEIEALLQHFSNKKIEPLWKGAETGVKLQEVVNARRIFTTFILGTALLNFTRGLIVLGMPGLIYMAKIV